MLFRSFSLENGLLRISWILNDPQSEVLQSPKDGKFTGTDFSRANDLWRETCFEAFWGIRESESYWELNLSPEKRSWNLYRFDRYRQPQPPEESEDFFLDRVEIRKGKVECFLRPNREEKQLEASICAVIKTERESCYFASKHEGDRPDFHRRSSFCIKID